MYVFFTFNFSLFTFNSFSQGVSINATGNPADSSAMLDVSSTTKGLLIPRVSLFSTSDVSTIQSPATSLLVFNTNAAMTGGGIGFWYFNGAIWVQSIGPVGPTGATGTQGIQGITGATGATGLTGVTGNNGTTGATGAAGSSANCPAAPTGETLIYYNGCMYVNTTTDQSTSNTWSQALTTCTGYTGPSGGESGWYLPNKMELDVLYQNFNTNGQQCHGGTCPLSGFSSSYYWSSTVDYATDAWYENFNSGYQNYDNRILTYAVRCVRR